MKKCGLALVALSALTGFVVQADDALPSKVYVGPSGSNTFPYATPETAAHDLTDALAAVQATEDEPGEIVVADGAYQCPDIWYEVDRPIYLHSENGPATTFLQGWRSGSASSNYRVLKVDHEKALVSGFTIEKGKWDSYSYGDEGCGGLRLISGVVSNCVIRNNNGNDLGAGANVRGGLLTHCEIHGNTAYRSNNRNVGRAGGVYVTGGTVADCVISNNVACAETGGCGVYLGGGLVTRCLIAGNRGHSGADAPGGIGVLLAGGTVEQCTISGNGGNSKTGGGVRISGGTLRDCLVADNAASAQGGGVYVSSSAAVVDGCTVVGNTSETAAGGGVYQAAGTVKNTIVFDNVGENFLSIGGTIARSCTDSDPLFVDAANGDYALRPCSPAIGTGLCADGVTPRDMGCVPYVTGVGPLVCGFSVSQSLLTEFGPVTLTGEVNGEGAEDLTLKWDYDGDGAADATGAEVVLDVRTYGSYTVTLWAENADGDRFGALTRESVIGTLAPKVYVGPNGSNKFPYATPETAAHDLTDAFAAVQATEDEPGEIVVADGTYQCPDIWYVVDRPIYLHSENGPATTILQGWRSGSASSNYRVLKVDHEKALVSGFTIEKGKWDSYSYGDDGCGGLRLISGVVSNCVIRNNNGNDLGGGVNIRGGLLTHCEIYGNTAYRSNNRNVGRGGGVYMTGGTVADCVITNNVACAVDGGCGVYLYAGTVTRCLIAGNRGHSGADSPGGIGVLLAGGTVEQCTISGNSGNSKTGGGVRASGGMLRDCLVVDNATYNYGGGIYMTSASAVVDGCTVVGNMSEMVQGGGVYQAAGTVRNTIVFDNDGINFQTVGGTVSTSCTDRNPLFVDAANGDYALRPCSPAIGTGLCADGVTPRDMGCVPYATGVGPLVCGFSVARELLAGLGSTTLTGAVDGEGAEGLTLKWDYDGDGVADATGSEVVFTAPAYGSYTITLWAEDGDGGRFAAFTRENVIATLANKVYVGPSGSNTFPYATPETAAHDLTDALAAVQATEDEPGEIVVADGTYQCPDIWYVVDRPIYLHSENGPATTILQGWRSGSASSNYRVLKVDHEKAFVSGFTIEKGKWDSYGYGDEGCGGLRLISGVVSNCVIRNNNGNDLGGGVNVRGGLLTHCEICGNQSYRSNNRGAGMSGGIYQTGGTMSDCVISNNIACHATAGGCGVYLGGGLVTRCLITDNCGKLDTTSGIGVYMSGGTMDGCWIVGNGVSSSSNSKSGGGVRIAGGTLRNCLIAGNRTTGNASGVYQDGGTVLNCTITDNASSTAVGSGLYLGKNTAICRNNIIYGNGAGVASEALCNLEVSAFKEFDHNVVDPATQGTDNVAKDPLFKNPGRGNYRLRPSSPCIDAGDGSDWVALVNPVDLEGNPRIARRIVDIGCYEANPTGLSVIVR